MYFIYSIPLIPEKEISLKCNQKHIFSVNFVGEMTYKYI